MQKKDLTQGNITATIFSFCIPLIIGSLIQMTFNMADQIVLGQMAGALAVASVGACSVVTHLFVNLFLGIGAGVNVVMARAIGARDYPLAKRIVSTSVISAVGFGILAFLIAFPLASTVLTLTKCPEDCFGGALVYLRIYYCAVPFIVIYNFGAALLRAMGDSRRPTTYLIIGGLANVVLNVVLCLILPEKVAAVAIATLTSHVLSSGLVVLRLFRMDNEFRLSFGKGCFNLRQFGRILRYGLPSGVSSSLYPITNIQVQSAINSFGSSATAGNSAVSSINTLLDSIRDPFHHTSMAMMGQGLGAGKRDRVLKSFWFILLYGVTITAAASILIYLLRYQLLGLYVPDDELAVDYGLRKMPYLTLCYFISTTYSVFNGALTAFGFSTLVMTSNIVCTVVLRTVWMQLIYPINPTFENVMLCFSVSWLAAAVVELFVVVVVLFRYSKGKMKKV